MPDNEKHPLKFKQDFGLGESKDLPISPPSPPKPIRFKTPKITSVDRKAIAIVDGAVERAITAKERANLWNRDTPKRLQRLALLVAKKLDLDIPANKHVSDPSQEVSEKLGQALLTLLVAKTEMLGPGTILSPSAVLALKRFGIIVDKIIYESIYQSTKSYGKTLDINVSTILDTIAECYAEEFRQVSGISYVGRRIGDSGMPDQAKRNERGVWDVTLSGGIVKSVKTREDAYRVIANEYQTAFEEFMLWASRESGFPATIMEQHLKNLETLVKFYSERTGSGTPHIYFHLIPINFCDDLMSLICRNGWNSRFSQKVLSLMWEHYDNRDSNFRFNRIIGVKALYASAINLLNIASMLKVCDPESPNQEPWQCSDEVETALCELERLADSIDPVMQEALRLAKSAEDEKKVARLTRVLDPSLANKPASMADFSIVAEELDIDQERIAAAYTRLSSMNSIGRYKIARELREVLIYINQNSKTAEIKTNGINVSKLQSIIDLAQIKIQSAIEEVINEAESGKLDVENVVPIGFHAMIGYKQENKITKNLDYEIWRHANYPAIEAEVEGCIPFFPKHVKNRFIGRIVYGITTSERSDAKPTILMHEIVHLHLILSDAPYSVRDTYGNLDEQWPKQRQPKNRVGLFNSLLYKMNFKRSPVSGGDGNFIDSAYVLHQPNILKCIIFEEMILLNRFGEKNKDWFLLVRLYHQCSNGKKIKEYQIGKDGKFMSVYFDISDVVPEYGIKSIFPDNL